MISSWDFTVILSADRAITLFWPGIDMARETEGLHLYAADVGVSIISDHKEQSERRLAWWELLCQTPDPDSSPQRHDIIHLCCPLRLLSGPTIFSHRTDQGCFWTEDNSQTPLDITKFKMGWHDSVILSKCLHMWNSIST